MMRLEILANSSGATLSAHFCQSNKCRLSYSKVKRAAEFLIHLFHIRPRHTAEFPVDHCPFNGSEYPGHQGRKEEPGPLPVGYQMIPEETASDVTGESLCNDFLP